MKMKSIAVLMTCYNRKQKTIESLTSLLNQSLLNQSVLSDITLDVYLVDDGSTDGTADAVKAAYPQVTIIQGNGSLFWNGGMRRAFAEAARTDYDYHLWLNDDTTLYPDALQKLLQTSQHLLEQGETKAIIAGSTQDSETALLSYGGGICHRWWHPLSFAPLEPGEVPKPCDVINGNCVLIPRSVFTVLGNLDPSFSHYLGDFDYALRAHSRNCSVWITPGYVGTCPPNLSYRNTEIEKTSLDDQLKRMTQPKGLPTQDLTLYSFKEWRVFSQRHGGLLWVLYYLIPYRRLLGSFLKPIAP